MCAQLLKHSLWSLGAWMSRSDPIGEKKALHFKHNKSYHENIPASNWERESNTAVTSPALFHLDHLNIRKLLSGNSYSPCSSSSQDMKGVTLCDISTPNIFVLEHVLVLYSRDTLGNSLVPHRSLWVLPEVVNEKQLKWCDLMDFSLLLLFFFSYLFIHFIFISSLPQLIKL